MHSGMFNMSMKVVLVASFQDGVRRAYQVREYAHTHNLLLS